MSETRKPNVIIVGAQKSGTSWLHKQLSQHADFFMSEPKELNFFNDPRKVNNPKKQAEYYRHFSAALNQRFLGESTPHYFWKTVENSPFSVNETGHDTAACLREALGAELNMIVSLRDPVSRAVSAYYHNFAVGRNPEKRGIFRCNPSMGIVDLGFYKRHWEHFASVFDPANLCTVLFDDVNKNPVGCIRYILRFLKAEEPVGYIDSLNLGEKINNRARLMKRRSAEERADPPRIQPQEVAELLELYREDIRFVSHLASRPLKHWSDLDGLIRKHCRNDIKG